MTTKRSISINLPNPTLLSLKNGNYKLVVFRGSASGSQDIQSTVMMTIDAKDLNEQNVISWEDQFYAFKSNSSLVDGAHVKASTTRAIELGDVLHIMSDSTTVNVEDPAPETGNENAINFLNDGTATLCGYSMVHPHSKLPTQICATSIPGRAKASLTPLNRYMLMFTSESAFDEGMCICHVESNAAIVNYEQDTQGREVSYNYNTGYWHQGVDVDAMYSPTNGWLSNVWDSVKKGGKAALNDVLNNVDVGKVAKAALSAL